MCSGPHGSLRICHEHLFEHGSPPYGTEKAVHWCDLPASRFCWDCCAYFCATHIASRHDRHRVEVIE